MPKEEYEDWWIREHGPAYYKPVEQRCIMLFEDAIHSIRKDRTRKETIECIAKALPLDLKYKACEILSEFEKNIVKLATHTTIEYTLALIATLNLKLEAMIDVRVATLD